MVQGRIKTEDRESVPLLPKASLQPTRHEDLPKTLQTDARYKVARVGQKYRPPVQQRSGTTVTDKTSMLTNHLLTYCAYSCFLYRSINALMLFFGIVRVCDL